MTEADAAGEAESSDGNSRSPGSSTVQWVGRIGGPVLAVVVYFVPGLLSIDMQPAARATAAIGTLMAVWWMTEALPLAITSLLPLILFPLSGVLKVKAAALPYADKNVFLFMGGFLIALAIERWNLHRRLALWTVLAAGTRPSNLIGGVMLATALISMWISNTATAAMMLPLGISLITLLNDRIHHGAKSLVGLKESPDVLCRNFATCVMLGIAYSSSIGGLGTLVGTPTNVTFVRIANEHGISISFRAWMALGVPLVLCFLICTWVLLTRVLYRVPLREIPGGRELIRDELRKLGPLTRAEVIVATVFGLTACAWIFRQSINKWTPFGEDRLDDTVIAMIGAVALFLIPIDRARGIFALDWKTANRLPWGVLLLFGGGFSLAEAFRASRLDEWIGQQVAALQGAPPLVIVLVVVTIVIFLTELTSNTPTAAAILPVLLGVAEGLRIPPLMLLIPATLAASCAFMLPVGTPPNAIVFGTGYVTIGQMCKAGWWLNLIGIALITLAMYTLGVWAFRIQW